MTDQVAAPTVSTPAPAPAPATVVTGVISGLLSWTGLSPQATNEPVPTPQAPTSWVLAGWIRREIGHTASITTPTVNATQTTQALDAVQATVNPSPLGTPEQIAAEQVAAQVVNSPVVQLAELVLKVAWLGDALQQFAPVGGPDQANLGQLSAAVREYATAAALQAQSLNSNDPRVLLMVAPPHDWYGVSAGGSRILYDNPDTIYRFIGVNGASSYVLTGRFEGGMPAETTFSVLSGLTGTTESILNAKDMQIAPDGSFTITVNSSPAAPGQTNHLQLPANATGIIVRNTLSDWNTQAPMSLSVTRVGGPPNSLFSQLGGFAIPVVGQLVTTTPLLSSLVSVIPAFSSPPPVLVATQTAIIMALGLMQEPQYMALATTDPATGKPKPPNVLSQPSHNASFLATQLQSTGHFQLANDQALVITINPGNAGYFVVPVTNDWTITNNYWDQQTSLNNAQAVANPDGTYTLVLSPTDPGVANWVSTGGLNQGTLSIRFQDLDPNSTATPSVSSQVVSLDQLGTVLPATTVYVTPAQRQAQIAARQSGFNSRFADGS